MYRAVALKAMRCGADLEGHELLGRIARESAIELTGRGRGPILLDGEDVTEAIRAEPVSESASVMSTVPAVRRAMVAQQREIGHQEDCVMEGRDIGTVVFPDADLKIFLVASLDARARRRLQQTGVGELGELREAIAERDRRDSTRTDSPLRRAEDAIELDTTGLTIEQQVERVIALAIERGAGAPPEGRESRG
jgi:cytidylate kinase